MPVMNKEQLTISKHVSRIHALERNMEVLENATKTMMGEIARLKEENEELKGQLQRKKRNLYGSIKRSIDRSKQLQAIQMILNGEFVLDTSNHKSPELVKSIFTKRKIDHT